VSEPSFTFMSSLHSTASSWWQKGHLNTVGTVGLHHTHTHTVNEE
jgi:hypothetical protein